MDWFRSTSNKQKYQGNYKFHIVVNNQRVDSSSTVSITTYTDSSQRAVVPCQYLWLIIKNGVPQQVPQFRGSSFICETAHIGYLLQAHVTSNDPEYPGKAIVTLGPVQLDVSLKTDILAALSQGYSNHAVYLIGPDQEQRECTIQIFQDKIKIIHAFSDLSYLFDYSILEPLFTYQPKEVAYLSILFNEKYQCQLKKFERHLFGRTIEEYSMSRSTIRPHNSSTSSQTQLKLDVRFLSRANRDIFLYILKGFNTKRQLKSSAVIRKIQKINFSPNEEFSAVLLVNQLRRDLVRYDCAYKKVISGKRRIQEKGSTYASMTSSVRREQPPPLAGKVTQLQRQNEQLNIRIQNLVQEISQIKVSSSQKQREPTSPQRSGVISINFKKKKEPEEKSFSYLLDDMNRSQQIVHFDAQNQLVLQRLQSEKRVLQMNLDQANDKINYLQKKTGSSLPGYISVQKTVFDRLRSQNQDLKRSKDRLERDIKQHKQTIEQLRSQIRNSSRIITNNDGYLQREIQELKSKLAINQQELDDATRSKELWEDKCVGMSRKMSELQNEVQMLRRNQDVLNRSQTLSCQMDDYNQEQIKVLKEHNEFLVSENQKLSKACQRYMGEAKQSIKLRQEILQLKQKLNKAMTNPQSQSFSTQ